MQTDMNLAHRADYGKYAKNYKKIFFWSILAVIISGIILGFSSVGNTNSMNIAALSLMVFAVAFISSIVFPILILVAKSKLKSKGAFEEIDICDNKIIYNSEKLGQKIIEPQNIKSIDIWKYSSRGGSNSYFIKIFFKDSDEPFKVPYAVSKYAEFVNKMKKFRAENNIPEK